MTELALRHHTGSNMDFEITAGQPTLPAGTVNNYALKSGSFETEIGFQNGPSNGQPNGVTIEALLEVCMIRLQSLNQGKFECADNFIAIQKIGGAIDALKQRTLDRLERGVEGKHRT